MTDQDLPFSSGKWFPETSWTNIQQSGEKDTLALSQYCSVYVRSAELAFKTKFQLSKQDAEDASQDFIAYILDKNPMQHATPEKGKFRNYFMRYLVNFGLNWIKAKNSKKRGGDIDFVSLDQVGSDLKDPTLNTNPSVEFDRQWARDILRSALNKLKITFIENGKHKGKSVRECQAEWDVFYSFLLEANKITTKEAADLLDIRLPTFKSRLRSLRKKYREYLSREVSFTVSEEVDFQGEWDYLRSLFESQNS